MQIQKERVRRQLMRAARKEFFDKGFKGTSMRTIAQEAGVSLSNIYNYFHGKDELFEEVLSPALKAIDQAFENHEKNATLWLDIASSKEDTPQRLTQFFIELIMPHRNEFKILLSGACGSALENYKEALIERHNQREIEQLRLLKAKRPETHLDVSEFFVHNMSSWWINTFCELVSHEMPKEQIEQFILEHMKFGIAGWRQLMQVQ